MNNRKLKRAIERTAGFYEGNGFRCSLCWGMLAQIFSISLDSVYPDDPGVYVSIFVDEIPMAAYKNILAYQTLKRKEIRLWIFDKNIKNDSGKCATFRIQGSKIVEYPRNMPIEKVLSSGKKLKVGSLKA